MKRLHLLFAGIASSAEVPLDENRKAVSLSHCYSLVVVLPISISPESPLFPEFEDELEARMGRRRFIQSYGRDAWDRMMDGVVKMAVTTEGEPRTRSLLGPAVVNASVAYDRRPTRYIPPMSPKHICSAPSQYGSGEKMVMHCAHHAIRRTELRRNIVHLTDDPAPFPLVIGASNRIVIPWRLPLSCHIADLISDVLEYLYMFESRPPPSTVERRRTRIEFVVQSRDIDELEGLDTARSRVKAEVRQAWGGIMARRAIPDIYRLRSTNITMRWRLPGEKCPACLHDL